MEKFTHNFGTGETQHEKPSFTMQLLEIAGRIARLSVFIVIFILVFLLAKYSHGLKNTEIIPTAEARESQLSFDRNEHFLVEYYVNGQRYVRTLNMEIAKLVEGTAKDLKINPAHLLAMCIQEGSVPNSDGNYYACDPTAVGDNGQALGAFQIHTGYHDISEANAKHIYYSARWTAERLLRKGYLRNNERAIRCHNSCNPNNEYGKRILQIARTLNPITS